MTHWLDKVITILEAETSSLRELARLAGGDPHTFYKGVDINKLDLYGQDIEGMEFSESDSEIQAEQAELELKAHQQEWPTEYVAASIKNHRRQEERATLLLAEFLQDRSRAMQIIENYSHDKASLTNSVLRILKEVRQREAKEQKQLTNLQIARKVSVKWTPSAGPLERFS